MFGVAIVEGDVTMIPSVGGRGKAKEVYIWGLEGGAAVLLLFELYYSFSLTYIHSRHKSFLYCKTIFVQ